MWWARFTASRRFSTHSIQEFRSNVKELLAMKGKTRVDMLRAKYREQFQYDIPHKPTKSKTMSVFLQEFSEIEVTKEGRTAFVELAKSIRQLGPKVINSIQQLPDFRSNGWYQGDSAVAIDCEGVPDNLYLIQVATKHRTYIFDTVSIEPKEVCSILQPLMEDPDVIKLMHDLRCDAIALRNFGGVDDPKGLLDTQLVMESLTETYNKGLNSTLTHFEQEEHPQKKEMIKLMKQCGNDSVFRERPLSPFVIAYAANDVELLLKTYDHIQKKLDVKTFWFHVEASIERYQETKKHQTKRPIVFDSTTARIFSKELLKDKELAIETPPPTIDGDTESLLNILPDDIQEELLKSVSDMDSLVDIALDVGKQPVAYCGNNRIVLFDDGEGRRVTAGDLNHVQKIVGGFGLKGRACLDGQLHRISAVFGRERKLLGVTIRFGRQITNMAAKIYDVLFADPMKSILILGDPGTGKTSLIRDMARFLSDRGFRTCIVDTSNEIAGDGDVPHHCIGRFTRRFMVDSVNEQADKMIEVVQNHTPEVLFLDEIGTFSEASAAVACRNRGVRLVASTHGNLESVVNNPELQKLIGGVQRTILSDGTLERMEKQGRTTRKIQLERAADPVFDIVVELRKGQKNDCWIYFDSAAAVDRILRNEDYTPDHRSQNPQTGEVFHSLHRTGRSDPTQHSILYSSTSRVIMDETKPQN